MPKLDRKTATLLRQARKSTQADIQTTKLLVKSLEQGYIEMNGFMKKLQKAGTAHKAMIRKLNRDIGTKKALLAKLPKS